PHTPVEFEGSDMDGFELYRRVRMAPTLTRIPVFLTCTTDDADIILAAMRLGVDHVMRQPADAEFIVAAMRGREARDEMLTS
ncbi:MAG: hypothetical protein VKI81_11725, partial [Synechococcaceae cyanobacterium]|nr:hypothetical protein [Synechococcaceae cyanobacterium]